MQPKYDLGKIKIATDGPTFEKAVDLYESGKVTQFEEGVGAYSAVVQGSQRYCQLNGNFTLSTPFALR